MSTKTLLYPILMRLLLSDERTSPRTLVCRQPPGLTLVRRAKTVVATAARQNLPIGYMGLAPLFCDHRVYRGGDHDWVLMRVAEDPLYQHHDGYPIPKQTLSRLHAVQAAGIEFDVMYVAHEVPKGAIRDGEPLDAQALMPPPPKQVTHLSRAFGVVARGLWAVAAAPIAASMVAGAAAAAGGLLAAPLLVVGAALALDPVLFGAVVTPGRALRSGEPACWFFVDSWQYGGEEE